MEVSASKEGEKKSVIVAESALETELSQQLEQAANEADPEVPQLGKRDRKAKRSAAAPPPSEDPAFEEKMNLGQQTINLIQAIEDPALQKARYTRRRKALNLEQQLKTLKDKTKDLGESVLGHPTFDKKIITLPQEALDKIQRMRECDKFEKHKEDLQLQEAKAVRKKYPKANQLVQEAETIIQMLKDKKPASVDPNDSSKRDGLKGAELQAAFSFYNTTVKRLAVCLNKSPHVCLSCWSIVFSDDMIITDRKTKLRRKIACSEVFKDPTTQPKHATATIKAWMDVAESMMTTPQNPNPVKQNTFPNLILPRDELKHACWEESKGAKVHLDIESFLKTVGKTLDPENCLQVAKGLDQVPVETGMLDLSESNSVIVDGQKDFESSSDVDPDGAVIREPAQREHEEVPAGAVAEGDLRDRLRPKRAPEAQPPAPEAPEAAGPKKERKPRNKSAKKERKPKKQHSIKEIPLRHISRPASPKSGPAQDQRDETTKLDIKRNATQWKTLSYVEDGVTYTKTIADLEEAWLSK